MRFSTTAALLLPALASASQSPVSEVSSAALSAASSVSSSASALTDRLSSLWGKVTPYMPSTGSLGSPLTRQVANLTAKDWAETIGSGGDAAASRAWLVVVSGGNQTCGSGCRRLDAAWAHALSQARAESRAPNLARVDCESNRLLCATWGAVPGSAWWIEPERRALRDVEGAAARVAAREAVAEAVEGKSTAPLEDKLASAVEARRDIFVVPFNLTTVGADDITRLYRKGEYKVRGELLESESLLSRHPFDGKLARLGLNIPLGYVYFAIGMVPSWTFIMMLSVTMRLFLNKPKAPKQTKEQKAEKERKEKYTAGGKVRGAPPGDGRSAGDI